MEDTVIVEEVLRVSFTEQGVELIARDNFIRLSIPQALQLAASLVEGISASLRVSAK